MAKSPFIFQGVYSKSLKSNLNLNSTAFVLQGTNDPTLVAQNAPAGSLYLRTGVTPGLYIKQDAGLSTNWLSVTGAVDAIHEVPVGVINGVNVNFTISQAPVSSGSLLVFVDGVELSPADYSLAGTVVTLVVAPVIPQVVTCYYLVNSNLAPVPAAITWSTESPVGVINGVNVTFTVTGPIFDTSTFDLYLNGVFQYPAIDYTLAGTTITMTVAPVVTQTLWATYRKT